MPQDIKYYQEFGGEKVVFEKEETTEMKKLMEKGKLMSPCCLCSIRDAVWYITEAYYV